MFDVRIDLRDMEEAVRAPKWGTSRRPWLTGPRRPSAPLTHFHEERRRRVERYARNHPEGTRPPRHIEELFRLLFPKMRRGRKAAA